MSLREAAARARHDLGKYVAMQVRWVGVDGPPIELREALRSDLLRTRGGEGVAAVWASLRAPLAECGVERIDALVGQLAAAAVSLEKMDETTLRDTARAALAVGEELRALASRVKDD